MECGCQHRLIVHGGVIENSRARNPLTLCSVPALEHVQVWGHIPDDPHGVQLGNATTIWCFTSNRGANSEFDFYSWQFNLMWCIDSIYDC